MAVRTGCTIPWAFLAIFQILIHQSKSLFEFRTGECELLAGNSQQNRPKIYLSFYIGSGSFGNVYEGILYNKTGQGKYEIEDIAVKQDSTDDEDVKLEYDILSRLVVKLQSMEEESIKEQTKKQSKSVKVKEIQDLPYPFEQGRHIPVNYTPLLTTVEYGGIGRIYGKTYQEGSITSVFGMVMQLLGPNLEEKAFLAFCSSNPKLFWKNIAPQMTACVLQLHSADLLHRDIKPSNFLFGSGKLKHLIYISDFGLSVFVKSKWRFWHKGNAIGTDEYMSPSVQSGKKYRYKDDYCSLIFSFIYLLNGGKLPWADKTIDDQLTAKKAYNCATADIPGGIALNNFLVYARSYNAPLRIEKPKPSRIWEFISAIQREVESASVSNIDVVGKIYQIPLSEWKGCPIINANYDSQCSCGVTLEESKVLYMRLEGIVARVARDPPSKFLSIDFVIESPPIQEFVSLNPGMRELIIDRCGRGYRFTFFTDRKDLADLASKYGLFVQYGVLVITTDVLKQVGKAEDRIFENSDLQDSITFTGKVVRMKLDLECRIGQGQVILREDWKDNFIRMIDRYIM